MNSQLLRNRVLFLILLLSKYFLTNAQTALSLAANLMQPGDSVTKESVEYVFAGDDGDHAVWDFSNLETGDIYCIKYDTLNNSQLVGYDLQKTYNYRIKNDSLFLIGYESPQLNVDYKQPLLIQPFPLQFNQTCSSAYHGEGRYCGTHYERNFGSVRITADAIGTLVLSEKDTLLNTLRVYTVNTESIRLSKDSCRNDSDNMKLVITEQYRWYARGYRYPVFETITSSTYDNMDHVATSQLAYRCPPEIQIELNDSTNERIRQTMQLESGNCYGDGDSNHTSHGNDVGFTYDVDINGNQITINYSVEQTATIHAMIVDVMGNIYQNIQQTSPAGTDYSMSFDCTGLRRGQYIIYINVNGKVYNTKISVK